MRSLVFRRCYSNHIDLYNCLTFAPTEQLNLKSDTHGPLKDWSVIVKDNIAVEDWPMTCASAALKDFISPYSADAVKNILDAGTSIIGKGNMDEFGMGSKGCRSVFGRTRNPLNLHKSAGGSSSGNAAAVASGLARLGIGSDTGGSVRLPASFTGIVGFKPSWAALSRYGLVSYAPSMDTIGLMTKTVSDCLQAFSTN